MTVSRKKSSKAKRSQLRVLAKRFIFVFATLSVLTLVGLAGLYWKVNSPLERRSSSIDAHVSNGLSARGIAEELVNQGLYVDANLFVLVARYSGKASKLKAGRYLLPEGISTVGLVDFLSEGKGILSSVTLVEGKTTKEYLERLTSLPDLNNDLPNHSESELANLFGIEGRSLEGWIYPDTYRYAPGSSLTDLLARAIKLQQQELALAWAQRSRDSELKTPYEALILASIVEKETGQASERPRIASVFNNRLRRGMLLQTDPTVIYGVGDAFDGNLTRKHLQTDTPYNSYTRAGLPPTPITNPGKASLYAATRPEEGDYLYFVAKGDGTSYFSKSLREHNNAVRRYQLKR